MCSYVFDLEWGRSLAIVIGKGLQRSLFVIFQLYFLSSFNFCSSFSALVNRPFSCRNNLLVLLCLLLQNSSYLDHKIVIY